MEFPVDGLMLTPTLHRESYFEDEQHRHKKLLKQRPVFMPRGYMCKVNRASWPNLRLPESEQKLRMDQNHPHTHKRALFIRQYDVKVLYFKMIMSSMK